MENVLVGRVLLVSEAGRVLLVGSTNMVLGKPTVWVAPGGTAELDETTREAAARELFEEVGITVTAEDLVGPVGFTEAPQRHVEYFLLPLEDGFEPTVINPDAAELAVWVGFRWWTAEEIEVTTEVVWPAELAAVLRARHDLGHQQQPWAFVYRSD